MEIRDSITFLFVPGPWEDHIRMQMDMYVKYRMVDFPADLPVLCNSAMMIGFGFLIFPNQVHL